MEKIQNKAEKEKNNKNSKVLFFCSHLLSYFQLLEGVLQFMINQFYCVC